MKEVFKALVIFAILTVALSALYSCSGNRTTTQEPGNQPQVSSSTQPDNSGQAKNKGADYPPIPANVAKAQIKNLDGSTYTVADKKGKVILLNLWATWCGPCRGEMPELVKMQDQFRDKDFEVIGVNTDDEPVSVINSFRDQMKLNYTLVWSDTALQSELLKISKFPGIPQSFLIDRDGRLRGVFTGGSPKTVSQMAETVGDVVSE
jgi:thiol-disulfide isomerase/thioredoxin